MSEKHTPKVKIIAAVAANGVIGCRGRIPWVFKADLRQFRDKTLGNVLLMGRKTAESLHSPLVGRMNVVLSRTYDHGFNTPLNLTDNVKVFGDYDDGFRWAVSAAGTRGCDVFVIGGGQIFRRAINVADEMILTLIDRDFDGDTFFPAWSPADWEKVSSHPLSDDGHDAISGLLVHLKRRDGRMCGKQ